MGKSVDDISNRILNGSEASVNVLAEAVEVRRGVLYWLCSRIYRLRLTTAADSSRSLKTRQVPSSPGEPRSDRDEINDDPHDHANLAAMNEF